MPLVREIAALGARNGWGIGPPLPNSRTQTHRAPGHGSYYYPAEPLPATQDAPSNDSSTHPLHLALHDASKAIPRYLFRVWGSTSGGHPELNTTHAITPLAFLEPNTCTSQLADIKPEDVRELIGGHLVGKPVKTPFSSWSQSLPLALAMGQHRKNSHSSVIDTHRLRPENYIFYCGSGALARVVGRGIYSKEFLIFGVISGDAYQAVPCEACQQQLDFLVQGSPYSGRIFHGPHQSPGHGLEELLRHAVAFGRHFGPEFELAMAIRFLAIKQHRIADSDRYLSLTEVFTAPSAWSFDASFPPSASKAVPIENREVAMANSMMTAIVEKLRADGRLAHTTASVATKPQHGGNAGEDEELGSRTARQWGSGDDSAHDLANHMKADRRMDRTVWELYIDMVGYDERATLSEPLPCLGMAVADESLAVKLLRYC